MNSPKDKKSRILLAISVITVILGICFLVVTIKIISISFSNKLLDRAKETENLGERLRYAETAIVLNETEKALMMAADTSYEIKDYLLASNYYSRLNTNDSKIGFAKANYQLGNYESSRNILSGLSNNEINTVVLFWLVKNDLRLGDIQQVRLDYQKYTEKLANDKFLLENYCLTSIEPDTVVCKDIIISKTHLFIENKDNRLIPTYNYYLEQGYPQTALALINEGFAKGTLGRDGLNLLAKEDEKNNKLKDAKVKLKKSLTKDSFYPQTYQQLISVLTKLGDKDAATKYSVELSMLTW